MASRKDDKDETPYEFILVIVAGLVMLGSSFLAKILDKKGFTGLEEDLKKATITKHMAMFKADALEQAMDYEWGTDEESIFNTLKNLNSWDFNLIYNAFGKRDYLAYGSGNVLFGDKKDLLGWFSSELSESEYQTVKNMFPYSKVF